MFLAFACIIKYNTCIAFSNAWTDNVYEKYFTNLPIEQMEEPVWSGLLVIIIAASAWLH